MEKVSAVFIVPGVPATRTTEPRGMPPPRASSKPATNVLTRSIEPVRNESARSIKGCRRLSSPKTPARTLTTRFGQSLWRRAGCRSPVAPSRGPSPRRLPAAVRLVRMTAAERRTALEGEAAEYAEAKARAGFWAREESLSRARNEIASTVGPDPDHRGHAFFFGVDGTGRRIGWVWFGPMPGSKLSRRKRWLYQIVVDEPLRGQGYGRGLLQAVERELLEAGVMWLNLNVFRWNSVAVALYESAGYEVVSQSDKNLEMRKRLGDRKSTRL